MESNSPKTFFEVHKSRKRLASDRSAELKIVAMKSEKEM
jgi:hypothetical protein